MTIEASLTARLGGFGLDAAFSAPARGITALFGPSGSGKTTLLRCIAGLERAAGRLCVNGDCWQDDARGLFVPAHRRPVGYVFQEASLFPHLTVRGNLEYGLRRIAAAERRVAFDQAVQWAGIGALLERHPQRLSGGERQRVAIARALLTSPRLLLMDEPLSALDQRGKAEIMGYLERLHEELSVPALYVSHATDEVARLADTVVLIEAGRVRGSGPVAAMLTDAGLPLAHGDDAAALIEATVADHDDAYHLTHLDFPGGRFTVTRRELVPGRRVRLRILARDVSLALECHAAGTSILNIIPAQVESLTAENPAQVLVRLTAGGVQLLARVTRKSADQLALAPGRELYAQVKSAALLA